jgi:hypothetical protein
MFNVLNDLCSECNNLLNICTCNFPSGEKTLNAKLLMQTNSMCNNRSCSDERNVYSPNFVNVTKQQSPFQLVSKGFRVVNLNIQHILPKLDEIKILLLEDPIHVLGLCETFLTENTVNDEIHIHGYNLERKDRFSKQGGGIIVYIK